MQALIIEDEDYKRANILAVLKEELDGWTFSEARSVRAAIQALREAEPDLVILDMSLPTFDIGPGEGGGRPQGFGGVEVLRYMDRFDLTVPVIVITAYEAFAKDGRQIDLSALKLQLSEAHRKTFKALIFYNSFFSGWREELRGEISRMRSS